MAQDFANLIGNVAAKDILTMAHDDPDPAH
jgi:hypothetical protein